MPSKFETAFAANADPALFNRFGVAAQHVTATTSTNCTVILVEETSSMLDEGAETRDVRRATIDVRISEVQPAVGDAFFVSGVRPATDQWVVIAIPQIDAGVASCVCEAVTRRNVNPIRAKV